MLFNSQIQLYIRITQGVSKNSEVKGLERDLVNKVPSRWAKVQFLLSTMKARLGVTCCNPWK